MRKVNIPKFEVNQILDSCKNIIDEGLPLVQDALERRQDKIQQFNQMVQKDLEEEREREAELEKLTQQADRLHKSNMIEETYIHQLTEEVEKMKLMPNLRAQERKLAKALQLEEKAKEKLNLLQEETKLYEQFQEHVGLLYLGRQEANRTLLASTKIHPKYPDDQYFLYFSKFDLVSDSGLQFEVDQAEPTFSEFPDLAFKYNESQKLRELIEEVHTHWKREACKEGQPRLATPVAPCSSTKRARTTPAT